MESLMTSGVMVETWIPPVTPFVRYEAKDESWARYFGIGHVEVRPALLYDVRDERGDLIGYTKQSPAKWLEQGSMWPLRIRVANSDASIYQQVSLNAYLSARESPCKTVEVDVRTWAVGEYLAMCWIALLEDAPDLARCEWIECLGQDNIHEFVHDLRMRALDRAIENRARGYPARRTRV